MIIIYIKVAAVPANQTGPGRSHGAGNVGTNVSVK